MSEFDNLFEKRTKPEVKESEVKELEVKIPEEGKQLEIKDEGKLIKEDKPKKKKKLVLTEEEINELINDTNQKLSIAKLMSIYEQLTGKTIRQNMNITIDKLIEELVYIMINGKIKTANITKEDVIIYLKQKKEELEE